MPLQDSVIPVSFGVGVDTKTDPKQVKGKLLQLQDGVIPQAGQVAKRNGYTNTISMNSLLTRSFNNQLLLADGQNLYSYSPDNNVTTKVSSYQSVSVTPTNIPILNAAAFGIRTAMMVYQGATYVCTTYVLIDGSGNYNGYLNITNADTGKVVLPDYEIVTNSTPNIPLCVQPFAIQSATPQFGFIYTGNTSVNNNLYYGYITAPFNSVSLINFPTPLISNATFAPYALNSGSPTSYLTYADSSNNIKVSTLVGNAITGTVTLGTLSTQPFISTAAFDLSGNIWVAFAYAGNIYYGVASPTLASVTAATLVATYTSEAYYANQTDPNALSLSPQTTAGHMNIYFTRIATGAGNTAGFSGLGPNPQGNPTHYTVFTTYVVPLTTSTVGSFSLFLNNAQVQTNFVTVSGGAGLSGGNFAVFANVAPYVDYQNAIADTNIGTQNTYFLVCEATASIVGKCLAGSGLPLYVDTARIANGYSNGNVIYSFPVSYSISAVGPKLYFGAPYTAFPQAELVDDNYVSVNENGFKLEVFNFNDPQAYQTQVFQNTVAFNGSTLKGYDGTNFCEIGFNVIPELTNYTIQGTGGVIPDGTYGYAFTYSWIDTNNQQYESSPSSLSLDIDGGQTTQSVVFTFLTLSLTDKLGTSVPPVYINIYRTIANGTVLYFVGRVLNTPLNSSTVSFTDTADPARLGGQVELYTTGNVLGNDAPPASMILAVRENRLYAVDSENPNTDYWYSKTANKGYGINFSGFLVETIDSLGGAITSIAQMDEKLVTFKNYLLGYQVGDGADDTGSNSTLTGFQFVPTDTGSSNHRSTITMPTGILTQTNKGIYLLSRGLQMSYFGQDVAAENAEFYTAATIVQNANEIRFLASSGLTAVYNYLYNQWSLFSNHTGTSADIFNGLYTYSRYDGKVFQENTTTYLDDTTSYALTAQIAWLKFAGIQGFERVKQMLLLGDHRSPASGHGIQMSAAYDFNSTFSTPIGYTLTNTSGVFQYREFLARQKCDSLSILIQEVVTGAAGEYIDFTDLSLYAGIKKGPNKKSAAESVG